MTLRITLAALAIFMAGLGLADREASAATSWTTVRSHTDRDYTAWGSTFAYVAGDFEQAPVRAVVRSTPGRVRVSFDVDCYDGNYKATYSRSWTMSYRSRGFNRPFRRVVWFTPGEDVYDYGWWYGSCYVSVDAFGPKGRLALRLQVPS